VSKALPNHVDPDVAGASKEEICVCGVNMNIEDRIPLQNVAGSESQMGYLRGAARLAEGARQAVCACSRDHLDVGSRIGRIGSEKLLYT